MNIHYIYKLVLKWKQEKKDKKNENVKMWVFLIGSSMGIKFWRRRK